jgi:membrane-associated phospholipid phosphatase
MWKTALTKQLERALSDGFSETTGLVSKRKCLKTESAFLPWASHMSQSRLKTAYASAAIYLILTLLIGIFVVLLPLNGIECNFVLNLQNFAQKTIGLQAFQILTYLGDFYLWVVLTSIYLLYAYFKSRKYLKSAIELAIFLVITTALTYFIKMVFARPRPDCSGVSVYDDDLVSSFSYPSGHVSRATGAFLILSRGSSTKESLAVIAVSLVSLSRIILGAHYLTDVVGGIFLSLAAQRLANLSLPFLARISI